MESLGCNQKNILAALCDEHGGIVDAQDIGNEPKREVDPKISSLL